jgi:hypothetical protein
VTTRHAITALLACAAIAAGCGDDDDPEPEPAKQKVTLAQRQAQIEKNPYELRCGDLADPVASARMSRIAQYALADDAQIRGLNRLQASQSIYYAITELCKARDGSYQPATDAIAGVRSGKYRADLGTP